MDGEDARFLVLAPRRPRGRAARRGRHQGRCQIFQTNREKETQMNRPVTLVEPGTVKLERLLPGPIERVWSYITDSDKRAKWLAAGEFDLRVGGRIELRFDNDNLSPDKKPRTAEQRSGPPMVGVITRLEPPHLLSHTWMWHKGDTPFETECTYQLAKRGDQVLLTIVH